ncbi:MAG: pro-sigmaK processing inhibitor BofA family protein [Porcipelethomonas sp.]
MNDIFFKSIWIAAGIIMLVYYGRRKKTFISAFFGMTSGCAALVLLHYFGDHIGFCPDINMFNTVISLVLGIPGTALIMVANMFG